MKKICMIEYHFDCHEVMEILMKCTKIVDPDAVKIKDQSSRMYPKQGILESGLLLRIGKLRNE